MNSFTSSTRRRRLVCPVRPNSIDGGMQVDHGWENLADGPIETLDGDSVERVNLDDEVSGDDGTVTRTPVGVPDPPSPHPAERARHNLTHWPHRSWCEHCVLARRPNSKHVFSPSSSYRTIPVFVGDYCDLRDSRDEDSVTVFVGRLYPSRMTFATVVSCNRP